MVHDPHPLQNSGKPLVLLKVRSHAFLVVHHALWQSDEVVDDILMLLDSCTDRCSAQCIPTATEVYSREHVAQTPESRRSALERGLCACFSIPLLLSWQRLCFGLLLQKELEDSRKSERLDVLVVFPKIATHTSRRTNQSRKRRKQPGTKNGESHV